MSDSGSDNNVLQEAIIALRYKIENEQAYKEFQKAMSALGGTGKSSKTKANVEVKVSGLSALKKLQKELRGLSKRTGVSVDATPQRSAAASALKRGARAVQDAFVGPPRPVPITRQQRASNGDYREIPTSRSGNGALPSNAPVVTVDQIKELGSAARAAAEAIRNNIHKGASGLNASQQREAIAGFGRSVRDVRSRLDPFAADANSDAARAAGSFSGLRFNRAAPDMSRMSFSPLAGASERSRIRIPSPDLTVFKRAIENLKQYVGRAGREMQQRLNIEPKINTGGIKSGLHDAMAQLGVGAVAMGFGHILDEAQHLQDQIRALTPSISEATAAQKGLFAASKDTNSSYKTAVDIYSALAVMKDKTKLDSSQAVEVVRSLQAASQIGGGSADGQERAIAQVEKAIAMNKLTVMGLNSIERQSRGITVALAEGMGVTVADLRKMAHEGKIGAEEMSQALLKMAPEMQRRLGKVRVTFGNLKNYAHTVMLEWATRLSDNWDGWGKGMQTVRDLMAGLNDFMSRAFDKLTSILGSGENAAKSVQYAFLSLGGGAVLAAVWAFGGAVLAALWPVVLAAGAVFTAIVAIDDILGWISGKQSVMGDLVGPFEKWKPMFDDIGKSFGELGKAWVDLWGGSGGMKDALNNGDEPPLAKSFRSMLQSIKDIIENTKELLRLLKALQNGDYGSALDIGGNVAKNGLTPGGDAHGMSWDESLKYSLYGKDPRNDPFMGWWIKSTDWMTGTKTLPIDQRKAQIDQMRGGGDGSVVTNNNEPHITVYSSSGDPSDIASKAADAVSAAIKPPMLPNSERGPR